MGWRRAGAALGSAAVVAAWLAAGPRSVPPDWQGELSLGRRPIATERWWRDGAGWRAERTYRWLGPDGAVVTSRDARSLAMAWGAGVDPWTGEAAASDGDGWRHGLVTVRPVPVGTPPLTAVDAASWLAVPVARVTVGRHRGADVIFVGIENLPEVPGLQARIDGGVRIDAPLALEIPASPPPPGDEAVWIAAVDGATRARATAIVGNLRGRAAVVALAEAAAADVPAGFALAAGPVVGVPGDCTERAERLVALAHGLGWPARVASGVVYRDAPTPSLRPHAWAEIWLGRWVPVDPSEPGAVAGPTHVRLIAPGAPGEGLVHRLLAVRSAEVRLR